MDQYVAKVDQAATALKQALDQGADIDRLNQAWEDYVTNQDMVINKINDRAEAERQAIAKELDETRNFVQTQEILTGKKI